MVNSTSTVALKTHGLVVLASGLVLAYVALTVASVLALVVLAAVDPSQATNEAWGHAVVVLVFAVVLPLRMRAARSGSPRALRAVFVIAVVVSAVNLVEALLPGVFPVWMRVEMAVVAAMMALLAASTWRSARRVAPTRVRDERG